MSTTMIPKKLALLVVKKVLLPGESIRIPVEGTRNMTMIRQHLLSKGSLSSTIIGVIPVEPRTNDDEDNSQYNQLHDIGTVAAVVQITGSNWPQPHYTLLVTGLCRFRLETVIQKNPYFVGQVSPVVQIQADDEDLSNDPELNALVNTFKSKISSLVSMLDVSVPVFAKLKRILDSAPMDTLADTCASIVKTSYSEKLQVLDAIDLAERFKKTLPLLLRQIEGIERLKKANDSETVLTVRRFGKNSFPSPTENDDDDIIELENKIKSAEMPDAVFKVTMKELQRLRKMAPHMPEHATLRTYLEMLAELPWAKSSNQVLDINKARNDLNADHYGMEKVKKRVLEYLAVRQLHNSLKGPILCFVGPPGVGKTSIGRSIANTLAREFHRISLGGVGDPSDIRGHRRTYIGAMPGRIIQGLRSVSVNNPVFLLDEVDKMGSGIHGDPEAALLEVLDPEQNCTFTDHYLNVPFDLSQILFIATANTTSTISPALLDRMEVIPVPGYTHEEKVQIAHRHLIHKQLKEHGLNENVLQIPEESIKSIVMNYTREAGVRNLERKLQAICRAVAVKVAENMQLVQHSTSQKSKQKGSEVKELVQFPQLPEMPFVIDDTALKAILGPCLYDKDEISLRLCQPGVAVGLAWTVLGGEIMFVEATTVDGDGQLILTGQLGDVMKESAKLALNWVRSHSEEYGIMTESRRDPMENKDVHIHFPAGAVEKDGPSAGVTIVTVLVSLFSRRCVRSDVAMTGEITLRGLVLPVGGIKEKVLAAHRAGIGTVILPRRNQKDLYDIPSSIQEDMTFVFPEDVDGVLQVAFEGGFPSSHTNLETVLLGKL